MAVRIEAVELSRNPAAVKERLIVSVSIVTPTGYTWDDQPMLNWLPVQTGS